MRRSSSDYVISRVKLSYTLTNFQVTTRMESMTMGGQQRQAPPSGRPGQQGYGAGDLPPPPPEMMDQQYGQRPGQPGKCAQQHLLCDNYF